MDIGKLNLQYLKSKTILVTGASRGIGLALTEKFLDLGNIVIGTSRDKSNLESLTNKFERNFYPEQLNLSSEESIKGLCKAIRDKFQKLDVLILNAGVLGEVGPIKNSSYKSWCETINVNLNSQYLLIKSLLNCLEESKKASIIVVSSSVGRSPRSNWGSYSVSKASMEALTLILSQELEETSITVNSVNPGATATKMRKEALPNEDQSKIPQPKDIIPIFLYLASNEATENGEVFNARDFIGLLNY
ncbi:SDR family NAD(P)-dependent oxidoreductase [bacterium]|nr:SDR family NAD(P)-dependent oxidoreductase [bacterium]